MPNKVDEIRFREISDRYGLTPSEVRNIVQSYFGSIVRAAKKLPFNTPRKIYTHAAFRDYERIWNIPCIGRIGTIYSRYMSWRANEAKGIEQMPVPEKSTGYTQEEIEELAKVLLDGGLPKDHTPVKAKRNKTFTKVWIVTKDGKKSAKQVIKKDNV